LASLSLAISLLGCGDGRPALTADGGDARDAPVGDVDAPAGDGNVTDWSPDADAAGGDAPIDGGGTDASGDGDAGPQLPPLVPPTVDCTPYAGLPACVLHVAPGGAAAGATAGLTWATAFGDLQDALDRATCACTVHVAAGTYLPSRGPDPADPDPRAHAFLIWPRVRVLGGFAGTEDNPAMRPGDRPTILSGDIGEVGLRDDNTYHVVLPADGASLDRVTVSGGQANGFNIGQGVGAGIFVVGAHLSLVDVTVVDNDAGTGAGLWADDQSKLTVGGGLFARNVAEVGGGIATGAATEIIGTTFTDNLGVFVGGAISSNAQKLEVRRAAFDRNRGDFGASIAVSAGDALVERTWFEGNHAGLFGGALFVRLGAHARLTNSVVAANSSVGHAGALTVWTASLDVDACTIADNSATFGGAVLVKDGARVSLTDTVLWRNSDDLGKTFFLEGENNQLTVTSCAVPAEVPATASISADPGAPLLGNVPLATRFAEARGTTGDAVILANADKHFTAGDRVELGDDGVSRSVTAVTASTITISPPWPTITPRFLRVDRWAAAAPSLTMDLAPTAGSPLVDAASAAAPMLDVALRGRVDVPGVGSSCVGAAGTCGADLGAIEYQPK
jgi:hypothetical protein